MEPCNKKSFQVRHSSIMSLTYFLLESIITRFFFGGKRTLRPGIHQQNLSQIAMPCSTYLKGVLRKNQGGSGLFQISQKEILFQSLKKSQCYLGSIQPCTPPLPFQKRPPCLLQLGQEDNISGHLKEELPDLFQFPIPTDRVEIG